MSNFQDVIFDTDTPTPRRDRRPLVTIVGTVAIACMVAATLYALVFNGQEDAPTPQSSPVVSAQSDAPQSEPDRGELFREATGAELARLQAEYDMTALAGVEDRVNPFKARPFGAFPYRVKVEQKWKDTYEGVGWQTMVSSVLGDLEGLWSDELFVEPGLYGSDRERAVLDRVRGLTYRDVVWGRLSGSDGGGGSEEYWKYYNGVVPVLDADGRIPGTSTAPTNHSRTVEITGASVEFPRESDADKAYGTYPRFVVDRVTTYGDGTVVEQQVTVFVQDAGEGWKIVEVEAGEPHVK